MAPGMARTQTLPPPKDSSKKLVFRPPEENSLAIIERVPEEQNEELWWTMDDLDRSAAEADLEQIVEELEKLEELEELEGLEKELCNGSHRFQRRRRSKPKHPA